MRKHWVARTATILPIAAALTACQGSDRQADGNQAIVAPTPAASATVTATPSPRSIMQPSIEKAPAKPAPLAPLDVTISFPGGGLVLDDAAKAQLDPLISSPQVVGGGAIVLRGSSDSRGSDADNRLTSKHRAQAVADYLVAKGIDPARMTVIALGEDRPIAPNANLDGTDNEAGRQKNRRVDITVTPASARPNAADDDATTDNLAAPPDNSTR